MELLHKWEAVLFLSFLLPLFMPALTACAQGCLHAALSKISQPQLKEQRARKIYASQSSISTWGLPVVVLKKPVFPLFSFGHFIIKMTSRNYVKVCWLFFLLCKRFPGWQWVNLPVCESLFQGTAVLKLISLVFLRTDAGHRTINMGNNVLQEFNSKGWDVLLGSCFGVWEGGLPFFTLFLRLAESIRLWNM